MKEICSRLPNQEAEELRVETCRALRKNCPPHKSNISWEEFKAIKEHREDSSKIIFRADKGVAMIVMDREDYLNKTQHLLDDRETYRSITMDPTSRLKNKLILMLRNIKTTSGLNDFQYKRLSIQHSSSQVLWTLQNPQSRHHH